jgi:ATP-dependent DNA ligase
MAPASGPPDASGMLMHAPNVPVPLARLRRPMLASEKLDGFRLAVMGNTLLTKSGVPHVNRNLAAHFADMLALSREGWVFDCECYCPGLTLAEHQSILQSHDAPIPAGMGAWVFDSLTLTEFYASRTPRFERRMDRGYALLADRRPANAVHHAHRRLNSADEVLAMYDDVRSRGGEGLVLRDPRASYRHGRCSPKEGAMFKVKPETMATAPTAST